jgi:transcriptional regulator with XRE-family HTH domain
MTDSGGEVRDVRAGLDWRRSMRDTRKQRGLSRADVAHRSGLSQSAIKAYESGDRHPSREALTAIIDALGLTKDQANPLLAGAGYATNVSAIFHQAYGPYEQEWFEREVEWSAWPAAVTNEASDIIAANRIFRRLVGIPLSEKLPRPERWNLIVLASDPAFGEHVENWDEVFSVMLGLGKADLRRDVNPERPAPWTTEAFKLFLQGDPAYVARLLKLWDGAQPVAHTTRLHLPVRWRHEGQTLRFQSVLHIADVWKVYAWSDWIPEDEATMRALAALR